MGFRRRLPALVSATLIACALAGCATAVSPSEDAQADVSKFIRSSLDAEWRGDGRFDRPSVVAPRFLLPNGWGFAIRECMVDSGFNEYMYDRSGGFSNGVERTSNAGTEGLAWYECVERFPTYDTQFSRLDDAQLEDLYTYYREWLIPCLALEGTTVTEVPTRGQFGDVGDGQPGSWNPYLSAELPASIAVASALLQSCAPYPEGWNPEPPASQ